MGELPPFRTEIKPAWTSVNMDLFGPYLVRDDCVKKGPRVFKKVWGVVYVCTLTRGVYLDVAVDYSMESILHTIRRLLAAKGNVQLIISDPGSQLKGASKELISWRKSWSEEELIRFGADKSLEWMFIMPDAQHQNGSVEIMVKFVKGIKKSFLQSMGKQILSLNELNTLMAEISNLANQRPIGVKPNSSMHPEYLSPNSLFLGRCSDRIPSGPFSSPDLFSDNPKEATSRFNLVQAITSQFWKTWTKVYFPTLIIRQKWHSSKRNVSVGDICLVQDSDAFRSEWRLGKVLEVYPDRFEKVRNVELLVKSKQSGSLPYVSSSGFKIKRHVSRLIVLVPAEEQDTVFGGSEENSVTGAQEAAVSVVSSQDSALEVSEEESEFDEKLAASVTASSL